MIKKPILKIAILLSILIFWSVFLYNVGINNIMSFLNITNAYVFIFLFALIGGVSFLTTGTYYVTLIALATSNNNPFLLGISGAIGIFFGDLIFIWLGRKASEIKKITQNSLYRKITEFIKKRSLWQIQLFCYLYTAFTPFPNDILMTSLGFVKIEVKKFLPFVFLGHLTLMVGICVISSMIM